VSKASELLGRISESPPPDDDIISKDYYHGTPTEAGAEAIWSEGLSPDVRRDGQEDDAFDLPVEGMVYVTRNLGYALSYALGANYAGEKPMQRTIKKYGQYGFLAVVPGSSLKDVHPDEDQVGEAVHDALGERKEGFTWLAYLASRELMNKHFSAGPDEPDTDLLRQVQEGDYDAWIVAGKILLPKLSDEQKLQIIGAYGNLAHKGSLKPSQMWKFDRKRSEELAKDGSNFFKLATRFK
jgi:hypothetical protein